MTRPTNEQVEVLRSHNPEPITEAVAHQHCSFFKLSKCEKPTAPPLDHHFSSEAKDFQGSALKKTSAIAAKTKSIPLGTGRPAPEFYPWKDAQSDEAFDFNTWHPVQQNRTSNGKRVVAETSRYTLPIALNYGHAAGSPHLIRFLTEHMEIIHNPPYMNWATCLSCGSTSALEIAFRIFCDRGDSIFAEKYTYPGFLEAAKLSGVQVQHVEMDSDGLSAEHLESILHNWDAQKSPKPRVLYTIPTGQNPTGTTQSAQRRKDIYAVAERHDIVIIEDDPYYFLQLRPFNKSKSEAADFKSSLLPSYLSIDGSGRVLRLDSTSKIIAPGLRAGWMTASEKVIQKFLAYHEVTTVAVSGISQLMLYDLLETFWGHKGFISWLEDLSTRYSQRLEIILEACQMFLPKHVCRYTPPSNGMFLWILLDWKQHHLFQRDNEQGKSENNAKAEILQLETRILDAALVNGVQVTKGSLFTSPDDHIEELYFRLTFAAATAEDLSEGVRRFAEVLEEEFSK